MPQLDHTGPEGKGPKTGRKLGLCKKTQNELNYNQSVLGIGMGEKRKDRNGECSSSGKRLKAGKYIE